ncbi:CRISPR-associated helicase Cas3 [Saccharolobus shibatae B12]|uniref:CRISPR-associated helicase Cas3 n=1 Tax=Saccharolobus shibatae (strain ATCC 51178 / DSM 5389 / JCM 8931 / NBRC 15437 / B12) TaxID=523848 RepID=A0A8F5BPB8_SACSH|nr:CRISPR-associated helicase Cas3' [Saccharolobus shibatae]QXJ28870.1 CRISPR-associated helicase Cas3 [Saccharolobus shibatae B12]
MSSLVDFYNDFITRHGFEERKGIEDTLNNLENGHSVVLKAPTGYGKTTLTMILANAVSSDIDLGSRVIHVLPYRAIVQDLYLKLKNYADRGIIYTKSIGAQDMDYQDSPFFMKKVNVTTLDTFILNLFKLPTVDFKSIFKNYGSHYEFPRALIYSSIVIFDEFHLLGEDGKSLGAGLAALEVLRDAGVPIIVTSATIDKGLEGAIMDKLGKNAKVVNATDFKIDRKLYVNVLEKEEEGISIAEGKVKEGKRVLLVYNTRVWAIEAYKKLKGRGLSPILIHSKFSRKDRIDKVNKINDAKLVVSTQVIEAGIDTSFDVLITEASPSHNLIQRAGRVARYGKGGKGKLEGEVYVFPFSGKVYDEREVEETLERVRELKTIDENLLIERDYTDVIDSMLARDLSVIDNSVFVDSKRVKSLYEEICSITRNASIILGFPPNSNDVNDAIPLTEEEAIKIIESKGSSALVGNGNVKLYNRRCLQLEMLKNDILGVRIQDYNSEIGGVY